ncbi:MAG: hypothetical protein CMP10_19060 [Zetaproteobacteria bacterium]|nr:hypothetical protein [Pseudobdellovibrionaceae bacterium]
MNRQLPAMAAKVILLTLFITQCSDKTKLAKIIASSEKTAKKSPEELAEQSKRKIIGEEAEEVFPVDEPVSVAGTFLTCIQSDVDNPSSESSDVFCKWSDADGNKQELLDEDGSMLWSYANPNADKVSVSQRNIQGSPFWAVRYTVSSNEEMTAAELSNYTNFVQIQLSVNDLDRDENPINLANSVYTATREQRAAPPKEGFAQYRLVMNSNADDCNENASVIEEIKLYRNGIELPNDFDDRQGAIGGVPAVINASHSSVWAFPGGTAGSGWQAFSSQNNSMWISTEQGNASVNPFYTTGIKNAVLEDSVYLEIDFGVGNPQIIDGFFINGGGLNNRDGDFAPCGPDEFYWAGSNGGRNFIPISGLAGDNSADQSFGTAPQ